MRYKVIGEFNSLTRRFVPGMEVDASEIDGAVPIARWVEMGKIEEAKPAKPDFASDQATLQVVFSGANRELIDGAPIRIVDDELFGTLRGAMDGATVDVAVFGEEFVRRYPRAAVDFQARTVSGEFAEERMTRKMQAATTAAARERAHVEPAPVIEEPEAPTKE